MHSLRERAVKIGEPVHSVEPCSINLMMGSVYCISGIGWCITSVFLEPLLTDPRYSALLLPCWRIGRDHLRTVLHRVTLYC